MKKQTKIKDTLTAFLFNEIQNDSAYCDWAIDNPVPAFITDNLHPAKKMRTYQEDAVKAFIYLFDQDREKAKHLLFNMATGTGKTLVMAACILFLYEKGYRNFVFLVHRLQILKQAEGNFTDHKFDKYLFNPKGIKIGGKNVSVRKTERFADAGMNDINIMFFSTSLLYGRLTERAENTLSADDFSRHNTVVIADEAHRLNVDTRSKKKTDQEEIQNWERAVMSAIHARQENMLLEFTATVDLQNDNIREKYTDKIIYRYDFSQFNRDGYSKDIKFLYNEETDIEDQKRLLIVNAVVLSEYRRLLAERTMNVFINPLVLIKSIRVADSEKDREFFDSVIHSIREQDLKWLQEAANKKSKSGRKTGEYGFLAGMFEWFHKEKITLPELLHHIRQRFAHDHTLTYNSQTKERPDDLMKLDDRRSSIRAVFSVQALNEGWDVLGLFDIIHFDISETKKVSLQDIQLIGRGARYCPYSLPKRYLRDEKNMFESMKMNAETDRFKRKFDNAPEETGRMLETFVYHFVRTGTFLDELQKQLLGEGIINEGVEIKTIRMKEKFLASETYQRGFVLVNKLEKRERTSEEDVEKTFKRVIQARFYTIHAAGLSEQKQRLHSDNTMVVPLNHFKRPLLEKALMSAENGFFRYDNLKEHIVELETMDEFIEKYLPLCSVHYTYEPGKDFAQLAADEKMRLLHKFILPDIRRSIDFNLPVEVGSQKFRPVKLQDTFSNEKNIYLTSFPVLDPRTGKKKMLTPDERAKSQTEHDKAELQYDVKNAQWYAYDENYGTGEEKRFVKWMAGQMERLREKYPAAEMYVIRNELQYWLYSPIDGRRFAPDYLLIINDVKHKKMYYQCIIEPKGGHLLDKDKWKEESLIALKDSEVIFDADGADAQEYQKYLAEVKRCGYQEIKNIGLKFFNTEPRGKSDFAKDFTEKVSG